MSPDQVKRERKTINLQKQDLICPIAVFAGSSNFGSSVCLWDFGYLHWKRQSSSHISPDCVF